MKLDQEKKGERKFAETYTIILEKGFAGDSISLFINDSLLVNKQIKQEPYIVSTPRFASQSALLIVDNHTEAVTTFNLKEEGGVYKFQKSANAVIKQLPQE